MYVIFSIVIFFKLAGFNNNNNIKKSTRFNTIRLNGFYVFSTVIYVLKRISLMEVKKERKKIDGRKGWHFHISL